MVRRLSVLVVDPDVQRRLETVEVASVAGLDCAGEATYGTEVVSLTADRHPTVVLVALDDPPLRGLATLEALQREVPDAPVIVYSSSANPLLMRQSMRAGARDYIELPVSARDLEDAIHTALGQEEQRQIARWAQLGAPSGKVLTVIGAKSATGKTAIAVNLAVALRALTGQETALVDGDRRFGDVLAMLAIAAGQAAATAHPYGDVDHRSVVQSLVRHQSGVDVLSADAGSASRAILEHGRPDEITSALAASHEYTIVDAPEEMTELAASYVRESATVLLVTAADSFSLKSAARAVEILQSWRIPHATIALIVNNATRAPEADAAEVRAATGLTAALTIAYDGQLARTLQAGVPIVLSHPQSGFARSVQTLAERFAGLPERRPRSRLGTLLGRKG